MPSVVDILIKFIFSMKTFFSTCYSSIVYYFNKSMNQ